MTTTHNNKKEKKVHAKELTRERVINKRVKILPFFIIKNS